MQIYSLIPPLKPITDALAPPPTQQMASYFAFSLILQSLRRFTSMKKNFLLFVISKNAFRVAQSSDETIAKR